MALRHVERGHAAAQGIEACAMTAVPPYGIKVPTLWVGTKAAELAGVLQDWGMECVRSPTPW